MKKEASGPWAGQKIKTLPLTEPGFASGLCSMVSLWLVLFPALIMAIKRIEFPLPKLILPVLGSLALATFIFYKWKQYALKIQAGKGYRRALFDPSFPFYSYGWLDSISWNPFIPLRRLGGSRSLQPPLALYLVTLNVVFVRFMKFANYYKENIIPHGI